METMLEKIVYNYQGVEIWKADGFDKAVIGIDDNSMRLIYSTKKCLDTMRARRIKISSGKTILTEHDTRL